MIAATLPTRANADLIEEYYRRWLENPDSVDPTWRAFFQGFTLDDPRTLALFELIAERYERRSILITANQPFSGWDSVFPDPGMTVAAIDRLVHHSTIFELNKVESYRGKEAARQQKIQRENDNASRKRQSSKDNDSHPKEPMT